MSSSESPIHKCTGASYDPFANMDLDECYCIQPTGGNGDVLRLVYIYTDVGYKLSFFQWIFFSSRKLNFNLLARVLSQTGSGIVADWRLLVSSHLSVEGSGGEESLNVIKQEEQDRKRLQRAAILISFPGSSLWISVTEWHRCNLD